MADDSTPRYFVIDQRGKLWPVSTVSNGVPVGEVVNPDDFAAGEASSPVDAPLQVVLGFLDAMNPSVVEGMAMARLGMGEADSGPTRHILDVLKELATEAFSE